MPGYNMPTGDPICMSCGSVIPCNCRFQTPGPGILRRVGIQTNIITQSFIQTSMQYISGATAPKFYSREQTGTINFNPGSDYQPASIPAPTIEQGTEEILEEQRAEYLDKLVAAAQWALDQAKSARDEALAREAEEEIILKPGRKIRFLPEE